MKKTIISFLAVIAMLAPVVTGQTPARTGDTTKPQAAGNAQPEAQKGLRFVSIDRMPANPVYIVLGKNLIKELTVRSGTPGNRFPYPENNRLVLIKNIPEKEGQQPEILLNIELPANLTDKTIVVLGNSAKGLYALFIDETELKPGTALFKNRTSKPYLMEMPTAPGNEPKQVMLDGGKDHLFGKTELKPGEDGQTYPVIWRHKLKTKNGDDQWFVERKMMVMRYARRAVVILLRPDATGRTTRMHEIVVFLPAAKNRPDDNTPVDGINVR